MPFLKTYVKTHYPNLFSSLKHILASFCKTMDKIVGTNSDDPAPPPPPPFDPLKPATPVSYPLKTLEELESRVYFESFHYPFNIATVKLPETSAGKLPERRRILVCHDMAGGYTKDDKLVQGGNDEGAYAIWHWYLMDVFVYFSHSLVTLPPPGWTNAAHGHGVNVLGTFIMEWDEGRENAAKLLKTKESAHMYAERLVELAVALGFDGWLVNMEVTLDVGQIPNLIEFVSHLSQTIHSSLPGSLVIWYDAVTIDGDLTWQNQLNDKNRPFFDVCDGIFLNYSWEEDFPKKSADVAGDRKYDLYMGIDVFGRGTYGGGQWTTNVALDVIKKDNVSAAIFAPGWVYETDQPPDFQTAQNRWWGLVEESWGIVQNYPKVLPFYSNFDQGHGYHVYVDGVLVSNAQWNNLSSQSFQPILNYSGDSSTQPIKVSVNFKDASYSGGGSITFTGTLDDGAEFKARLFHGQLLLGNSPLHFTYTVKTNENSRLGLSLQFLSPTGEKKSIFLAGPGNTLLTMNQFSRRDTIVIMPQHVTTLESEPGWIKQRSVIEMDKHVLQEINFICHTSKPRKTLSSVSTNTELDGDGPLQYNAAFGDIKITTSAQDPSFPPPNSWLLDSQFVKWTSDDKGSKRLSVKIAWQLHVGEIGLYTKYNIYVAKTTSKALSENESPVARAYEYLGLAVASFFYVSDLEVARAVSAVKFVIQVCGVDETCQKLEDCPYLLIPVQG